MSEEALSSDQDRPLLNFISQELQQPVSTAALAMSEAIRVRHDDAALAVLFYGSCLRKPETQLVDALLDFYVLVDDYRRAYDKVWLAWANQLLPPNVFYLEIDYGAAKLRAKYAVISLRQFQYGTSAAAANVSLWARFCQPVRLTWSRNTAAADAATAACAEAVTTMLRLASTTLRLQSAQLTAQDSLDIWTAGFQATYRAELRPEGPERANHIVANDAERYIAITPLGLAALGTEKHAAASPTWRRYRLIGKLLNIARLFKAAFTFDGGLDYVLWKIARHSGVTVTVTDWQRRHPLLAAPRLAWQLYRQGAFR